MHVTLNTNVEVSNTAPTRAPEATTPFSEELETADRVASEVEAEREPESTDSQQEVERSERGNESEEADATDTDTDTDSDSDADSDEEEESTESDDTGAPEPDEEQPDQAPQPERSQQDDDQDGSEVASSFVDLGRTERDSAGTIGTRVAPSTSATDRLDSLLADLSHGKSGTPTDTPRPPVAEPVTQTSSTATGHANAAPASEPVAPPAAVPRFTDPRTAQLAESARTSIFKQVAMKISPEGGELRVRLDPPELGHLDLRMLVDRDGSMRLHIIAERPEVTQVIERHLNELRDTLSEHGIDITEANIQSGSDGSADEAFNENPFGSDGDNDIDHDEPAVLRHRGFITAEGLDFLV